MEILEKNSTLTVPNFIKNEVTVHDNFPETCTWRKYNTSDSCHHLLKPTQNNLKRQYKKKKNVTNNSSSLVIPPLYVIYPFFSVVIQHRLTPESEAHIQS